MEKGLVDLFGILYLINKAKRGFKQRIRMQKMILLATLDKSIKYPFSFKFERYHYGPYSFELQDILNKLVKDGLVIEGYRGKEYSYKLTEEGNNFLKKLFSLSGRLKILKKKLDLLWKKYSVKNTSQIISKAKQLYGW